MARIKHNVQYVFIHPSWRGGWCWDKVIAVMKAWGREAYAPDRPGRHRGLPAAAGALEGVCFSAQRPSLFMAARGTDEAVRPAHFDGPGHGSRLNEIESVTLADYPRIYKAFIEEHELDRVVLVLSEIVLAVSWFS